VSVIGASVARPDAREKVTGAARYPADLVRPGQRGYRDRYRGRLMIPTYALTGEVIDPDCLPWSPGGPGIPTGRNTHIARPIRYGRNYPDGHGRQDR